MEGYEYLSPSAARGRIVRGRGIDSAGAVFCANCIHCKLVPAPADAEGSYRLRVRCDAGKWRKKLGDEKIYKYFTVARRNIEACDSYEDMGDADGVHEGPPQAPAHHRRAIHALTEGPMKTRFIVAAALAASLIRRLRGRAQGDPRGLERPRARATRPGSARTPTTTRRAIAYYKALDQRFGSDPSVRDDGRLRDRVHRVQGRALRRGQGRRFEALLAQYSGPDGAVLPPRYAILAKKVIWRSIAKSKAAAPAAPAGQ